MQFAQVYNQQYLDFLSRFELDERVKPAVKKTYEIMKQCREKYEEMLHDPEIVCRQCRMRVLRSETVLKNMNTRDKKRRRVCFRCGGGYEVE